MEQLRLGVADGAEWWSHSPQRHVHAYLTLEHRRWTPYLGFYILTIKCTDLGEELVRRLDFDQIMKYLCDKRQGIYKKDTFFEAGLHYYVSIDY